MKIAGSVLGLLLTLTAPACTSKPPLTHDPFGLSAKANPREAESTVVLLDPLTREPHCSATSVVLNDRPALVTAAHCVAHRINTFDQSEYAEKIAYTGDRVYFIPKRNWGSITGATCGASLVTYDPVHDRAVLQPDDDDDLPAPLPISDLCARCSVDDYPVHSISAFYNWAEHTGEVNGRTIEDGVGFWTSSISIKFGWSGSPVINQSGQMIAIIAKCTPKEYDSGRQCQPNYSILTDVR